MASPIRATAKAPPIIKLQLPTNFFPALLIAAVSFGSSHLPLVLADPCSDRRVRPPERIRDRYPDAFALAVPATDPIRRRAKPAFAPPLRSRCAERPATAARSRAGLR